MTSIALIWVKPGRCRGCLGCRHRCAWRRNCVGFAQGWRRPGRGV